MRLERVTVECYCGGKANEHPTAFTRAGRRHVIDEIVDRWYEGDRHGACPALDYFRVRTDTGLFLLCYNPLFDSWALCLPE